MGETSDQTKRWAFPGVTSAWGGFLGYANLLSINSCFNARSRKDSHFGRFDLIVNEVVVRHSKPILGSLIASLPLVSLLTFFWI